MRRIENLKIYLSSLANFSNLAGIPEKGGSASMTVARFMNSVCRLAFIMLCFAGVSMAQTETAAVSGLITDDTGAVVPGAEVKLQSVDRGIVESATTNNAGIYVFASVHPGPYQLTVHKPGFKQVDFLGLIVNVQDHIEQNFRLQVGSVSESVTVEASAAMINTTDATVGTVVDRNFIENMPLNGRSFQDLILLTPGVVTNTPQMGSAAALGGPGEFSVNGQRTDSNYYTIDGVSGNVGVQAGLPGAQTSGSLASATALGTTQSLVSVDALEEFRVQSSTYSAEYGRNPGGQFSFLTRSGTNQWHGTAFDYLRNNAFDANNWFNDYYGLPEPPLRQNDFGGTFGGPIDIPHLYNGRDKTFFFFSYEGLRVLQPQAAQVNYVPDTALRQSAPSSLQPVLNAFPVANGADLGNGLAEFTGTWSNPAQIDSLSIRLDHSWNEKLRLFFRFSDTSSNSTMRPSGDPLESPSMTSLNDFAIRTYTLGMTNVLSSSVGNDFRLNYSSNSNISSQVIDSFGGGQAVNLARLQGINTATSPAYSVVFGLTFGAENPGLIQGSQSGLQRQWNIVDAVSVSLGRHQFKFGVDYRRLSPIQKPFSPYANYFYFGSASVQANSIDEGVGLSEAAAYPLYTNFSAFIQDEWHLARRLSISMGLRWDVNPAPGAAKGNLPYTVQGAGNLNTMTLAPQGTPLWKTSWYNFAPRLGVAYVLRNTPSYETVVRGGGGVFFDTGQQPGSLGYQGVGFSQYSFFGTVFPPGTPASFPAPLAQVSPPLVNPPVPPYSLSYVYAFPPHFQLPYTLQWNGAVEQELGKSQALTISYVGAHGGRLLEQDQVNVCIPPSPCLNPNFGTVYFEKNGLTSDYDALQVQFQRRISHGLQALASYTWSHSLDYGSFNFALPYIRGNSDFDVRHNFSGALTYDLPNAFENGFARATLHHWAVDSRISARTGFPVTLLGNTLVDPATGGVFFGNLNLVPGQPLYIYGSQCAAAYNNGLSCPGGRAINPNAFSLPPAGEVGNAPRNFARGFGAWQTDFAVRREFPIYERLKLQFRAEAFNIFNHPSFGAIDPTLGDPTFGQAIATLNSSLVGLSPLYQLGGSRSMQLALKLIF
jgi:hypothetical protein